MKRIAIALALLLLFTIAVPAAAQDWARVFDTVPEGEPRHELLVLDPDIDRADRARYRRLPLGSAGLAAWAVAQRSGHLLRLTPDVAHVEPAAVHRAGQDHAVR